MADRLQQAIAAHQAGNLQQAEKAYGEILSAEPDNSDALNAMGILRLQSGEATAALSCFERAVRLVPETAKYSNNVGNARLTLGDAAAAVAAFEQAVQLAAGNADFRANLATARLHNGDGAGAEVDFRAALDLDGEHYEAGQNLGALLSKQNRLLEALPYLEKAVQNLACQVETKVNLASTYERLNKLADAQRVVDGLAQTGAPMALVLRARLLRRNGDPAAGLALLEEAKDAVAFDALSDEVAGVWHHETALCADPAGRPELVFENILLAKRLWRRASGGKDGEVYLETVRRLRRQESAPVAPAGGYPDDHEAPRQVFFVGFPRSGTTLLEVILDAHPDIVTTSEAEMLWSVLDGVDGPDAPTPRRRYLRTLEQMRGPIGAAAVIVDKHPLNLIHCRRVAALFPQARLLVALRDPRDVVLSCLMQSFRRNQAMRNFDTLGSAVALYEEVMGLWLEARADLALPWLEYRYEDLVADKEATLAHVLDFIGVAGHADMDSYRERTATLEVITPSYRGVAEPIYNRSIGRWRAYESDLAPMLDRLAPFVEAFGYDP